MIFTVTSDGFVHSPTHSWACALGRAGIGLKTSEGDGLTPLGHHKLGRVFWRKDRVNKPTTELNCVEITPNMGWCDASTDADYNTLVTLPHPASHEDMWRDDHVYDIVIEVLFNVDPIVRGAGSAIFIHIAKPDYSPTEGCIALNNNDIFDLLQNVNEKSIMVVSQK